MVRIKEYHFGEVVVDGVTYTEDLIILPDRIVDHWWRNQGHKLSIDDLEAVLEAKPEVLIIGQGAYGRMRVPKKTRRALEEAGIEVMASHTKEATETHNELRRKRKVATALHLTC